MADQLIQHVSDTAFWVANYRVLEGLKKSPLFHDPLAGVLAGERGRAIAQNMGNHRNMEWTITMRTYVIDAIIQDQIKQGVDTVINLGAGLDTRPYRMSLPKGLQWIEVDFPGMIEYKEARLSHAQPQCALERISMDLSQPQLRQQLFAELNARSRKALILTEGVLPYLTLDDAGALMRDLRAQPHFSAWITDYFSPLFMRLWSEKKIRHNLPENAPFRFHPENWTDFHKQNGWAVEHMYYLGDEAEKVDRPMPLPLVARILMPLANEKKRRAIRQLFGYGLMKPA